MPLASSGPLTTIAAGPLPRLTIDGNRLMAGGGPVVLRGLNLSGLQHRRPSEGQSWRTTAGLSELQGRIDDILELPDGRLVTPAAVWQVVKRQQGVLQYQVEQVAPGRFAVRLATVDGEAYEQAVPELVRELRKLLGGADVDPSRHEELRSKAGGKFRAFVLLPQDPQ